MIPKNFIRACYLLIFLGARIYAEELKTIVVPYIEIPPKVDAMLDEKAWQNVIPITDFLQRLPREGMIPTERTEVYLGYTTKALYVGVRAFDSSPRDIVATVMRRDDFEIVKNDQFVIAIDPYNDGRNGSWFSSNPVGVRVDAQFFDEGEIFESNWDGNWNCKARITGEGWMLEMEIPFSTLRFRNEVQNIMGINFFRRLIRTNEQIFSPLIPLRYDAGTPNVSIARKYLFQNIMGATKLHLQPYALSGVVSQDRIRSEADAGLDLRYNVNSSTTASLSINTDFAETEVDERQINFTRFSLFVPEKRDFFLENSGLFSFGIPEQTEVFFSRRIGLIRDDQGNSSAVPILFGAKVTSKLSTVDIGFLDVQTRSASGGPPENFGVMRVKAGVAPRSYVGGIITNKLRESRFLSSTFGVDMTLFVFRDISLTGFAATTIESSRQQFSADSSALYVSLVRSGARTAFHLGALQVGELFDPALGFIRRDGFRRYNGDLQAPWYIQTSLIREIVPSVEFAYYQGLDGRLQDTMQRASIKIVFQSEDALTFFLNRSDENLITDFPLFPFLQIPAGKYDAMEQGIEIATKQGRTLSTTFIVAQGDFYTGSRLQVSLDSQWKVNKYLTLSQTYRTNHLNLAAQKLKTDIFITRVNLSLNTNLSIALLGQYDNLTDQLGVHFSVHYLYREGKEIFLVLKQADDETILNPQIVRQRRTDRAFMLKGTYAFEF